MSWRRPTGNGVRVLPRQHRRATWRERALNAEDALKTARAEILAQRTRIGECLKQVRDLEAEWTQEAVQRITSENTPLNNASANSPATTAPWKNDSKQPAPTSGAKTDASQT